MLRFRQKSMPVLKKLGVADLLRVQNNRGFAGNLPLAFGCQRRGSQTAVTGRFARPEKFPMRADRRCDQRFRCGRKIGSEAEIYNQQSVIAASAKKAQEKNRRPENRTVESVGLLLTKNLLFPPQFQKIFVKAVEFLIFGSFGEIEFRTQKGFPRRRITESVLHFRNRQTSKLPQKTGSTAPDRFDQFLFVVGEITKWLC